MAYYAIGNHQYLIKDTKKIKTMVKRAKCNRETNFITSVVEQKELINNFNIYDTLENIDITELTNYKSTDEKLNAINIIYSRVGYSDISDLFYKCIKHYNIVPSNIKSNKTKINYFELNLNGYSYLFSNDPNDLKKCNWKIIKELCNQHNIEFKNQSFVKFIKQLRDNFMLKKSERKTITEETRKNIISKHNNQCAICKNSKSDIKFEIDHIKPLASGGTNDITNLQPLCKSCHKEKTRHEQEDGEYVRIFDTESSYNAEVTDIMKSRLVYSYAFCESLNSNTYKHLKNYHIDINKCRKNIMYYSQYDYAVFTVMDKPDIYNKDIQNGPGIYVNLKVKIISP